MKKLAISFAALALVLAGTFTGCKTFSVNTIDNPTFVIVSSYSNPNLPWRVKDGDATEEYNNDSIGNGGLISQSINRFFGSSNPELNTAQDRADYLPEATRKYLLDSGVNVVDHAIVKESKTYSTSKNNFLSKADGDLPASDYKLLSENNKSQVMAILAENNADYAIYIKGYFMKDKVDIGLKTAGVKALIEYDVKVYSKEGKRVFWKEYHVYSPSRIDISFSKYDKQELIDLFYPTIDKAAQQFVADFVVIDETMDGMVEEVNKDLELYEGESTVISLPAGVKK